MIIGITALLMITSCSDSDGGKKSHADVLAGVARVCRERKAISSADSPSQDLSADKRAAAIVKLSKKFTAAREDFFSMSAEDASDAALITDLAQKAKELKSIDLTKDGADDQQRQLFQDTRDRITAAGQEFACLNG